MDVSWSIKKAERQRIDAFELWCWRRLLRVPWTARRSNQSILREIVPGCSLEGLMLKLKLQYFGLENSTDHVYIPWGHKELDMTGQLSLSLHLLHFFLFYSFNKMASLAWWTWIWVNSWSWWWTGRPGVLRFMGSQRVGHDSATKLN